MKTKCKTVIKKTAAVMLAAALSLGVFGGVGQDVYTNAADQDDYEQRLAELEEKMRELDERIALAGGDIEGQKQKLAAVSEKAEAIHEKIDRVSQKAAEIEDEMADIDSRMRDTQYELDICRQNIKSGVTDFKDRLRALYVAGNDTYSDVLLDADNFYDVLMRVELVKRVAEHDNETINGLIDEKNRMERYAAELEEQSGELKEKSGEYAKKQKQLAEENAELEKLKQEYGDSIDSLSGELDGYILQYDGLTGEYNKVSEEAKTTTVTTTTTTTMTTAAAKKTKKPKETEKTSETEEPKQTTVPQTQPPEETTTTTTTTTTAAPPAADEPPETTTATTTAAETTKAPAEEPSQQAPVQTGGDIQTVIDYAKGMVGGRYVWAGNQYGATDCSGLVMLSYRQIGIELPHYAASQANYGTLVSRSDIQPGDLVFFGGASYASIYHVAMYIGDGKVVHAESTATGIVISYLDSVAKYNNITCIKRLV